MAQSLAKNMSTCDKPSGSLSHEKNSPNSPILSIIIPCYNCAEYLDNSVGKIATLAEKYVQQDNDFSCELLVIEDASDDDGATAKKCSELAKAHNNIRLISLQTNKGQAHARNVALGQANGYFITFVDADDTVADNYFEIIAPALKTAADFKSAVIVFGATEQHFDGDDITKEVEILPGDDTLESEHEIKACTLSLERKVLFGYLWNKVYSSSLLKNNNIKIPDEHLIEDHLFNLEVFKHASKIVCINKSIYFYARRSSDTVTGRDLPDYFEQYSRRIQEMYGWITHEQNIEATKPIMRNYDLGYLKNHAQEILGAEYIRFTYSEIMRNVLQLPKNERKSWLDAYYEEPLTKELLDAAKPEGKIAVEMASALRSRNYSRVFALARLVRFVNDHLQWLMIRLRQSR